MENYDLFYQNCLLQVERSIEQSIEETGNPIDIDITTLEKSESTLDGWDYCFVVAIGLAGVFITSSEKLAQYMESIHKTSSGISGKYDFFQTALGKLLHHKGDYIDSLNGTFMNRAGENADCLFHRLLWGHDIISIGKDNPFYLMFQQKGLFGILQVIRHLIADTMSKQGLPLPGSSFFDYTNERGKISNHLITVAKKLSDEAYDNKTKAHEIYAHMATIRAQDIAGGVVIKVLTDNYIRVRKINDDIRRTQIRLMGYAIAFLGQAVYGCIKQKGVPYINFPLAVTLGTTFAKFCYLNNRDIKRLYAVMDGIITIDDDLINSHAQISDLLPTHESADEYIEALVQSERNADELITFFGENAE